MLERDLAWAAGFFDGEGCVRIGLSRRAGVASVQASLTVDVGNTHRGSIERMCELFPGFRGEKVRLKHYYTPQKRRPQYEWNTRGLSAYEFCKAILPYSVVKREQLELAIQFYSLPWRTQRNKAGGGYKRRSEADVLVDMDLARRMKEMKNAVG